MWPKTKSERQGRRYESNRASQKSRRDAGATKGDGATARCRTGVRRSRDGAELRGDGVGLLAVDAEVLDGFLDDSFFDFSVEEKLVERGEGDEARVHFKEIAEGFAAVAAAEAVGAERGDAAGNPRADHVRQSF